jgi:hypothetical protein
MSTPSLQLKQKRRGDLAPRREKAKKRLLIFWGQAREYRALVVKSTHTDAQEEIVRSFVSHNVRIISFPAQIGNNLIKYCPHADRKKPSASLPGVFVCVASMSLRDEAKLRRGNLP